MTKKWQFLSNVWQKLRTLLRVNSIERAERDLDFSFYSKQGFLPEPALSDRSVRNDKLFFPCHRSHPWHVIFCNLCPRSILLPRFPFEPHPNLPLQRGRKVFSSPKSGGGLRWGKIKAYRYNQKIDLSKSFKLLLQGDNIANFSLCSLICESNKQKSKFFWIDFPQLPLLLCLILHFG